jgi:hypothetical protein
VRDAKHLDALARPTSATRSVILSLIREGNALKVTVPGGPLGAELYAKE